MKLTGLLLLLVGSEVMAQYGPRPNKNKRPATTTEVAEALNEVVPGVHTAGSPQPGSSPYSPGQAPQTGQPGSSPYTPGQAPHTGQPGSSPYTPGQAPQTGQPSYFPSNSGVNQQHGNTPSQSDYWWAGPNSPFKPGAQPQASYVPNKPQQPGQGYNPAPQPQQPYQPNQPNFPPQSQQPNVPYQPQKPHQPNFPQQPQQPQQPYQPNVPQQPQQPQQPYQPNYPQQPQQPQQPYKPNAPQQPQQPYQPNKPNFPQQSQQPQQPHQNFPQQPSRPQSGYAPGKPSQPGFPNQPQQSFQPQSPYKPPQGQPSFSGPNQPSNQGSSPLNINNNPYLTSALQKPGPGPQGVACNTEGYYCVPAEKCYNGRISDSSGAPHLQYKKGPCGGNEVCCQGQQQGPQPNQPGRPNQPFGSQRPSYVTEPSVQKYTGPLNTTPYPGCAAALKCVEEIYCTAEGVMSDTPVALTREQAENRVPLSECQDMNTGILGKCCRDPNYKDPWPAGMMMNKGFDDGQYHPPEQHNQHSPQQPTQPSQPNYNPQNPPPQPPPNQPPYNPPANPQQPNFPVNPPQPVPNQPYNPPPQPQAPYQPPYNPPTPPQPPQAPSYNQQPPQSPQTAGQPPTYSPANFHTIKKPLGAFNTVVTPFPVAPKPGQTHAQVFPQNEDKFYGGTPSNVGINQISHSGTAVSQNLPNTPYTPNPGSPPVAQAHPVPKPPQSTVPQGQTTSQPQPQPGYAPQSPAPGTPPGASCGVRRPATSNSPDETGFGEFPWHAVISSSNGTALCSGAIISPNAVLTVAHCVQSSQPLQLIVKVGVWVLGQPGPKPEQTLNVAVAAIHPAYDSGSLVKDQAVVITQQPIVYNEYVENVCLPKSNKGEYVPKTGACIATGFGRPNLQSNTPGSVMHKVEINVLPRDQCQQELQKTHLGKYFILNDGYTCAGPRSQSDLCKLDVGSPMVCDKGDGTYEIAGAYSWDTQCNAPAPGVLSAPDTDWIEEVLNTPVDQLKEQQKKPEIDTSQPEDIDSKPGFALGYGK